MQKITPNLWFDHEAEEAANFYISVFKKDARVLSVSRYTEAGFEVHHMPAGTAMTVEFELFGQHFLGLNGGPVFTFNEAVSFIVECDTQDEIDTYWAQLSVHPDAEQCGWLKDKYGLSWQIVPKNMGEYLAGPKAAAVMEAFLKMKKIDIAALQKVQQG